MNIIQNIDRIVTRLNETDYLLGLGDIVAFLVLYTIFLLFVPFNFVSLVLGIVTGFGLKKLEIV